MTRFLKPLLSERVQFLLLAIFLSAVFLLGGASRYDVQSLLLLRPLSAIMLATGLLTLSARHWARHKFLAGFLATAATLVVLHLIPLPPAVWAALPGRDLLVQADAIAMLPGVWRPLTMTPFDGLQSLLALLTPAAALVWAIQLEKERLYRLVPLFLILGAASGLLGILQILGPPRSPLYFYDVTNNGSAVGFFANRNHSAVFLACLFPMAAVFASTDTARLAEDQVQFRSLLFFGALIAIIPLLLVTGSRAGLFVGLVGLAIALVLYKKPRPARVARRVGGRSWRIGGAPAAAVIVTGLLVVVMAVFSRAEALNRIFRQSAGEDTRTIFWARTIRLVEQYFPWGSGAGSFPAVFKIGETNGTLSPLYVNHAHNDWLEVVMTFGIPGAVLLVIGVIALTIQGIRLWRVGRNGNCDQRYGQMAFAVIAMFALASITDYPLRTPSLASMSVICLLMLSHSSSSARLPDNGGAR